MHQITPTEGQRIDARNLYAPLRTDAEAQQQQMHRGVWPLHPPLPAGCDQQGRYVTRRVDTSGMSPAECCTEMGANDEDAGKHMPGAGALVVPFVVGVALIAALLTVHFLAR